MVNIRVKVKVEVKITVGFRVWTSQGTRIALPGFPFPFKNMTMSEVLDFTTVAIN